MLDVALNEDDIRQKITDFRVADAGEISLTDAHIIVSGGRGVAADPPKGFELVGELARVAGRGSREPAGPQSTPVTSPISTR